jgi:hypothetical protein
MAVAELMKLPKNFVEKERLLCHSSRGVYLTKV